ncbi:MAG TPA: hypothetical protein VN947_09540 [Polyangia bacterium]|nr:hypothetical protein [Polyangia bacterium]
MRNRILILSFVSVIGCGVEGRAPNPTPPPVPDANEVADEKADRACKYHCADYGYDAGECYQGWQCDAAGSCLKYVGTPDAPTQCPAPPPPPPSTSWRDGLPAGDLDLYDDLPFVFSTNGWAGHAPLRLSGNRTGTVRLTFTSGETGGRPPGDEQTVVIASDGSFSCHLDFLSDSVLEDLTGRLLPGGKVEMSYYRYQNKGNGADFVANSTFTGGWAPTPADWYYR